MTQKKEKKQQHSPKPRNKDHASGSASVLIVDDHPAMRSTMFDILEDEGFLPSLAASGNEAVELCGENDYDAILMDVQMPDLNGIEALRAIRELPPPHPRFLFMSAYSVSELKEEAYRLGAMAFLRKPLDPDEVLHLLRERNALTVLLHLDHEQDRKQAAGALEKAGFHVVETSSFDEVLINARQISYRFIVFEHKDEEEAESLKQMLAQVCPLSQALHVRSKCSTEDLLEEIAGLRTQPVRRESMLSGW